MQCKQSVSSHQCTHKIRTCVKKYVWQCQIERDIIYIQRSVIEMACSTCQYVAAHDFKLSMRCLERQGKATQHDSPKAVIFQRKNWLTWVYTLEYLMTIHATPKKSLEHYASLLVVMFWHHLRDRLYVQGLMISTHTIVHCILKCVVHCCKKMHVWVYALRICDTIMHSVTEMFCL